MIENLIYPNTLESFASPKIIPQLKNHVVALSVDNYLNHSRCSSTQPPEYLSHIWQMIAVTSAIIQTAQVDGKDKFDHLGQIYDLTHDIGRSFDLKRGHVSKGYQYLRNMGFPSPFPEFAIAHDRWGMGRPIAGSESFAQKAVFYLSHPQGIDPVSELDEKFTLAGLAAIIADNSKYFPDKSNPHMSYIVEFSRDIGHTLINRQLEKGAFSKDGGNHVIERLGPDFLMHIIDYTTGKYGINYSKAINVAQEGWPAQEYELHRLWEEIAENYQNLDNNDMILVPPRLVIKSDALGPKLRPVSA